MLQAVLFDLGDTLLDFEPINPRAVMALGARTTYDYLESLGMALPPYSRYARHQLRTARWDYCMARLRRREFNSLTTLARISHNLGLELGHDRLLELAWRWYAPIVDLTRLDANTIPMLQQLHRWGLKVALVSNTFVPAAVHDRHLDMLGLLPLLPVRVYSSEFGYRKPDPRIFHHALAQMGVSPDNAMFVGNLIKTDIVGPRRLGMKTVLKQPTPPPAATRPLGHPLHRRTPRPHRPAHLPTPDSASNQLIQPPKPQHLVRIKRLRIRRPDPSPKISRHRPHHLDHRTAIHHKL